MELMKSMIPMNREEILTHFYYDREQGKLFNQSHRSGAKFGKEAGSKNVKGINIILNGKRYKAHQIIYFLEHGYQPTRLQHIDGNLFNNHHSNLVDNAISSLPTNKRNKSGVKNVFFCNHYKVWKVCFRQDKKAICIGRFEDKDEAIACAEEYRKTLLTRKG